MQATHTFTALARVPAAVATGEAVEVKIRDRQLKARVVQYHSCAPRQGAGVKG